MVSEVIGLKISCQFINQCGGKPRPIATCTRHVSRALTKLHGIATNFDWLLALFAPAVIGHSNYFGIGIGESISHPFASLTRERYFQHSKIKYRIPPRPGNILYIHLVVGE